MFLWIFVGAVIVVVLILVFNSLTRKKNQVFNVSATLDAMLKKRYDLIPNLVEVVKGYAAFEQKLFEKVATLRSQALTARSPEEKGFYDTQTTKNIGQLFALVEKYPTLKADKQFIFLQVSLNEIEEQISAARRAYNASVMDMNTTLAVFPTNYFGKLFGFKPFAFFSISEEEKEVPKY